jgi:hypothetical protein
VGDTLKDCSEVPRSGATFAWWYKTHLLTCSGSALIHTDQMSIISFLGNGLFRSNGLRMSSCSDVKSVNTVRQDHGVNQRCTCACSGVKTRTDTIVILR